MDGLAARLFRGRLHPVELATRIIREADLATFTTPAGPGVPNSFRVTMGGEPEPPDAVAAAERELEAVLAGAAAERGWRLEGPPRVTIGFGGRSAASVVVECSVEAGDSDPYAALKGPGGRVHFIGANRSVVGRGGGADVALTAEDVSRRHALVWREAGRIWVEDLGSSNGTLVNGVTVTEPVELEDGDRVALGGTTFEFWVL